MSTDTFEAPDPKHLGELLPAFDFEAFIAKGGMGAVYKARQRSLDRDVAIKILPKEFGDNEEFRQSFETEAKAMAKLNHPNLIGVYDFGTVEGMPYIVMEYVDGKSLYHSSYGKAIDPAQAVDLVRQISLGLNHAHENGILHRDIKPANILLTPKAEPKIGDFGLAQPTEGSGDGLIMGTPGYAAPEIFTDPKSADQRADIYAVGVILHELLTGERADPNVQHGPRKPTGDLTLDSIVRKATADKPEQRYQSAAALAKDLAKWQQRRSQSRLVALPAAGVPGTTTSTTPTPESIAAMEAANQRASWNFARNLLIIAVLAIGVLFTWKLLGRAKDNRAAENERIKREQFEAKQRAEAEARKKAEEARLAAAREQNKPKSADKTPPEPVKPTSNEPFDSLERLQEQLVSGNREEMPVGTIRHGNADYLLVKKPMTWNAAAAFCEDHGGYLTIPASEADVTWLSQLLDQDTSVWIGGGRSDGSTWVMMDGSGWPLAKTPTGVGDFASVDDLGLLRARPYELLLSFVIQWQRDGSNPGSLDEMLRHTRDSLDSPAPVFPPGTRAQGSRHFCILTRPVNRFTARRLAEQAGGTLAVPATQEEIFWLEDAVKKIPAPDGLWLGASREGAHWQWDTNEPWTMARWSGSANPVDGETAMLFIPERGWIDAAPDTLASGFIIEWSTDAEKAAEKAGEIQAGLLDHDQLKQRATELVQNAYNDRNKKISENTKRFIWDVDVWLKGLNSNKKAYWEAHTAAVKEALRASPGDRFPDAQELNGNKKPAIQFSEEMAKSANYALGKQVEIDKLYQKQIETLHRAYLDKIREAGAAATKAGQKALVAQLKEVLKDSEDIPKWLASLGLPADAIPLEPKSSGSYLTSGSTDAAGGAAADGGANFVGSWSLSTIPGVIWDAEEDGNISSRPFGLGGKWKQKGDTVVVTMGGGNKTEFVWKSGRWRGTDGNGKSVVLRPAN